MGYLLRTLGVPDCERLTLSAWLRMPPTLDEDGHLFFEFGNPSATGYNSNFNADLLGGMAFDFFGKSFEHPYTDYYVWLPYTTGVFTASHLIGGVTYRDFVDVGYASLDNAIADYYSHTHPDAAAYDWTFSDTLDGPHGVGFTVPSPAPYNLFQTGTPRAVSPWTLTVFRGQDYGDSTHNGSTAAEAAANAFCTSTNAASDAGTAYGVAPHWTVDSKPGDGSAFYKSASRWHTARYHSYTGGGFFTGGAWHHVLLSFDASGGIVDESQVLGGEPSGASTKTSPFHLIVDGQNRTLHVWNTGANWPSGLALGEVVSTNPGMAAPNPIGREGALSTGFPFYLPCNPSPIALNHVNFPGGGPPWPEAPLLKEYGTFQLWNNLFVDITNPTNFAKFVKITGSQGFPENPDIAAAAFGPQTILFEGKASDQSFYLNRGSGGPFGMNYNANDFTPLPSYG